MPIDIKHLRSSVQDKAPQPGDMVEGQIAINYNQNSPAAYIKDDAGNIVKIAGSNSITSPNAATESAQGIAELATQAEVNAGTDDARIVTPLKLKVELDKKAPLNSPALTGTPTAPTPAAGDNDTSIATTEFVTSAIAAIPDATETVKGIAEIATAAEVTAGADDTRIVTPLKLRQSEVWTRTGTTLSPATAGDDVDIGSGNITLNADGASTFAGILKVGTTGSSPGTQGCYIWNGDTGSNKRTQLALYSNTLTGNVITLSSSADDTTAKTVRYAVDTDGTVKIGTDVSAAPTTKITLNVNGTATFKGNITAPNVSDIKFKTDIQPANAQLADVVALGSLLKNWSWTEEAPLQDELKSKRFLGLIAQEAEKVCPQLVYTVDRGGGDADYKALNNDILVMKLLGAVAEQHARIEALEAEVQALKGARSRR